MPTQLSGGEGKAWRAGVVVLKPDRVADEVVSWLAASVEAVADTLEFRMSRHVPADDGRWVVDGWVATTYVEGAHASGRFDDRLTASRAFHAAIAHVASPPSDLTFPETPWRVADSVAWNERERDVPPVVADVLTRLRPLLDTTWAGAPPQVIHGDIAGNVLFAEDLAPAIIDMSPYVRPAEFSNAIAVVDMVAWEAAPLTLAIRYTATVEGGDQLLARAVVFRLVAAVQAWPDHPERVVAEVNAYQPVLSAVRTSL